jgi:maltose/maltodextrin transport system substrate-binding protein/arabinogalactan oligomer/maltooligosaccharide transport system substrate-binding protein
MTKKLFTLITLIVITSMILVACTAPTEEAPVEEPAAEEPMEEEPAEEVEEPMEEEPVEEPMEEEPAEEAEEPAEEEVAPIATLRIWADDTRSAILADLADDFLATYNVEVVVEEVANIRDQFTVAAPAGEGPDITIMPHDQAGSMVDSGLLAPIDLGAKAEMFVPSTLDSATYDGVLYGMPYATENLGFFYNTELVPEPPTSWDEVLEVGRTLIADGSVTYGLGVSGTTYDLYPLMTAYGGYIFGRDDAGNWNAEDLGVDGEGMIAAGAWLKAAVEEGFISESTDWDNAHVLFETGEVPFLMAGPWALDRIRESGVPYAITNFPSGTQDGYPFSGVQIFVVNAFSENVLLAQAFLTEFVATGEVMNELYVAGKRPSAFIPVLEATDDADLLAMGIAGENATAMPTIPEMGSVWGSWNDAIVLILTGEQEPADALATAGVQIRSAIGGAFAGMVNVPGSWQAASGVCDGDWDPACEGSALVQGEDGLWTGTFELPAGDYEVKVALDGGWTLNYGVDGVTDGDNYAFSLAADGTVTFTYDPETHLLEITIE